MDADRWVIALYALGGAVIAAGLVHIAFTSATAGEPLHVVVDMLILLGSGLGIVYAARWHARNHLPEIHYPRIAGWLALSAMLSVGLSVVVLYLGSEAVTPGELAEVVHISATFGLLAGLVIGTVEGVATHQTRVASRERTRADLLEDHRGTVEELNELLRHYILNGVCIIDGYANRLRDDLPTSEHEPLDAIQTQTHTMTVLTEHFKPLWALREEDDVQDLDLDAVLAETTPGLIEETGSDLHVDEPLGTHPLPSEMASSIELLVHALATMADDGATIGVSGAVTDDRLHLRLTVEPITLSDDVAQAFFEPVGTGTGLELYLARQLVQAAGTLELVHHDEGSATVEYRVAVDRSVGNRY